MKNKFFLALLLITFAFPTIIFSNAQQKGDRDRIHGVIQELEDELVRIASLRNYFSKTWTMQFLLWDYDIKLDERKVQIIKDIFYFKELLEKIESENEDFNVIR